MTFEDVLEIKNGRNQRAVENPEGKYPIYGSGGIMGYADDYICDAQTVIVGRKGSINNPLYVEEPFWNVDTAFGLCANRAVLLPRYLYYFCKRFDFERLNKAVTIPSLTKSDLLKIEIDLPRLEEQQEVVNQLIKTEQIIELRKKELEELDNLIKSRFVEMFGDPVLNPYGWKQTTLKDVAVGKLSYGSGASAVEFDGTCRYVRITDITESGGLNDDIKSPDKYDEKYLLHDGDVLFARSGATVGKTLRYSSEKHGKGIYAGYLIRLVPNIEKVLPDYVFYYTKTEYYASFVKKAQRAVAQPNINAQEYGDLTICVPPINLQEDFMTFVTQVDKLKFMNLNQKYIMQKRGE